MDLQYTNLVYTSYEHVNEEFLLTFDLTVKDLDGIFLGGEEFVFTFVASDNPKYNTTEIAKQILADYLSGKIDTSNIKEYDPPESLDCIKDAKRWEIKEYKEKLLVNGFVTFDNDVFEINDKTQSRLASTLQNIMNKLSNSVIDRESYRHKWISKTNVVHEFTVDQLFTLNDLIISSVQTILLRCNYLCDVIDGLTDKREVHFLDWLYDEGNNVN